MRRGLARGIIYAAALLGLFAMHGLTVDHSSHVTTGHPMHAMMHQPEAMLTDAPLGVDSQHMGTACVAILAGVFLLLVGLTLLRRTTTAARSDTPRRTGATRSRSPPNHTWSLSQLCVLRT